MREFEQNHFSLVIELVVGLLVTAVLLLLIGNAVVWGSRTPSHAPAKTTATAGEEKASPPREAAGGPPVVGVKAEGSPVPLPATATPRSETPPVVPALPVVRGDVLDGTGQGLERGASGEKLDFLPPIPTPRPQVVVSLGRERVSTSREGVIVISPRPVRERAARAAFMDQLEGLLRDKNLAFEVDRASGTVFLPELFQFSLGSASLSAQRQEKIKKALDAFAELLPCHASGHQAQADCRGEMSSLRLRGVLIVGKSNHEGNQARRLTNMTLAFGRASTAFNVMLRANPKLFNLLGSDGDSLFRIEAMGSRATNPEVLRRVEFRFVMAEGEGEPAAPAAP
ncbi:MAG: hypothetical protein HQL66_06875 [Magnetococcales bacterium]|nr:hypothetical protein [Magnetococcales bacterium]